MDKSIYVSIIDLICAQDAADKIRQGSANHLAHYGEAVIAGEAKQSILSLCREMDCFASLAMTTEAPSRLLTTGHSRT
jgi:hypothetical protein